MPAGGVDAVQLVRVCDQPVESKLVAHRLRGPKGKGGPQPCRGWPVCFSTPPSVYTVCARGGRAPGGGERRGGASWAAATVSPRLVEGGTVHLDGIPPHGEACSQLEV